MQTTTRPCCCTSSRRTAWRTAWQTGRCDERRGAAAVRASRLLGQPGSLPADRLFQELPPLLERLLTQPGAGCVPRGEAKPRRLLWEQRARCGASARLFTCHVCETLTDLTLTDHAPPLPQVACALLLICLQMLCTTSHPLPCLSGPQVLLWRATCVQGLDSCCFFLRQPMAPRGPWEPCCLMSLAVEGRQGCCMQVRRPVV